MSCKIGLVFAYVVARDMQAKLARALIVCASFLFFFKKKNIFQHPTVLQLFQAVPQKRRESSTAFGLSKQSLTSCLTDANLLQCSSTWIAFVVAAVMLCIPSETAAFWADDDDDYYYYGSYGYSSYYSYSDDYSYWDDDGYYGRVTAGYVVGGILLCCCVVCATNCCGYGDSSGQNEVVTQTYSVISFYIFFSFFSFLPG